VNEFLARLSQATPPSAAIALFWLEQSHFIFKTPEGLIIHVDPFLSRTIKPENFIHPEPLIKPEEAVAGYAFLTHDHRDHTDPDTVGPMARAFPKCRFVGPAEACARCRSCGIAPERLAEMKENDEKDFGAFKVKAVYAQNTSDHDATAHFGFIFDFAGLRVYHAGDTRKDPDEYAARLGAIKGLRPDAMLIAINEGYNNPGPQGAARLVEMVAPRLIVPCHYDCFKKNTIVPQRFLDALPAPRRATVRILRRGESILITTK